MPKYWLNFRKRSVDFSCIYINFQSQFANMRDGGLSKKQKGGLYQTSFLTITIEMQNSQVICLLLYKCHLIYKRQKVRN